MVKKTLILLLINFGGLILGAIFMGEGPTSSWYNSLNQAPWTPPGWVFGAAWTSIMITFSIYISKLFQYKKELKLSITLFATSWILNVMWNPLFFHFHLTAIALITIILLNLIIGVIAFFYFKKLKLFSLLILPYFVWLLIAVSLNLYVVVYN